MNRREKIIFRADLYFFLLIFLFMFVSTQTASVYKYLRLAWKTPNLQFICFGRDFIHTHSQFHTSTKNAIMCKNIEKLLVINLFHIIYSILFSLLFYFFRFFFVRDKKRHHLRDPQCAKAIFSFCMKFIFLNGFFRRSYAKLEVCSSNGQMLPLNDFK